MTAVADSPPAINAVPAADMVVVEAAVLPPKGVFTKVNTAPAVKVAGSVKF